MPLVHRTVTPQRLSSKKLQLSKTDSEFIAVNNGTLVAVLRQLASLVTQAGDIFLQITTITEEVGTRVRQVKLRLDELEVKAELFDPKLVPVPEGNLDDGPIAHQLRDVILDARFFRRRTRPKFLLKLYEAAGTHEPNIPTRSPITTSSKSRRHGLQRLSTHSAENSQRPASFSALRDWKLDDYVDEKIATLDKKKGSTPEELNRALSKPFPSQLVTVDVTGRGFDRMKANRRSLIVHTKKIRMKKKRRNTICGSMPNKECGIQTSFSSVTSPSDTTHNKKYGIDSGHWSSCTSEAPGVGAPSSSAPSPWDPNSLSTSSDFFFDDEDRSLTPQLENFTDGMVSDSDSVDTEGYFTSFRNECGFPKSKKVSKDGTEEKSPTTTTENEYELFGKGSTSTTASSCGTVVLRNKPDPPVRTCSVEHLIDKKSQPEDAGWEERVKRKSLIERVPSLVVVTPSPSCSSASPPPLKDPDIGRLESPQASSDGTEDLSPLNNDSESGTLSDTDSDKITSEIPRASSSSTLSSCNSTQTLTNCSTNLPRPDVIPDVQVIRTMSVPKLDIGKQYFALDTVSADSVLLGSSEEEHPHDSSSGCESKTSHQPATSGKIRGARVVLDANGEIIFSSETLRRKRRHKVSFDPGTAVRPPGYDKESTYSRARDSIYDRIIRKDSGDNDKLYECIEEIRRHNLKESDAILQEKCSYDTLTPPPRFSDEITESDSPSPPRSLKSPEHATVNVLLETDLDSAIPPIMPELKTLPKIKDRLKRNESYRIATDEVPPRAPPLSVSPINLNNNNKRMSLNNMNKKRDIPEEDPAFIQQILNFSNSRNSPLRKSPDAFNRSITLSKLALSPDDRPSFLRRESPPTMDDITKEIYRFRKKFNIQPNASSTKLCAPAPPVVLAGTSTHAVSKTLPVQHRPLPPTPSAAPQSERKPFSLKPPVASSTPVRKSTIKPFDTLPTGFYAGTPTGTSRNSGPSVPKMPFFTTKIFCALKPKPSTNPTPKSVSFSIPKATESPVSVSNEPRSRTSLSDFKKLLMANKPSPQRASISAVELLKPKVGLETTL